MQKAHPEAVVIQSSADPPSQRGNPSLTEKKRSKIWHKITTQRVDALFKYSIVTMS